MDERGEQLGRVLIRIAVIFALYSGYGFAIARLGGVAQPRPADERSSERYAAGREVWRSCACQTCHSIYGLGGHSGPDLTNVLRRGSAGYVRATVLGGRAGMPPFALTEGELDDLALYLEAIDATGTFPPRSWKGRPFGEGP